MRAEDAIRVRHMIGAAEAAQRFVQGRTRSDLDTDQMLQFALIRAVEVIGEAASKVSTEGRALLPQVPWANITGTRNRLVHAYFDVELDTLWVTASQSLPALLVQLNSLQLPE